MAFKYFNVKNGLVTGNILLHAGNGVVSANTFTGNISVTDSANLGNVTNLKITGGSTGYVLTTDGLGNLSWSNPSQSQSTLDGVVDEFVGNGDQSAFTLSVTPTSKNVTFAVVQGLMQPKSVYSVTGNVLTFSSPPPANAVVEITTMRIV